MRRVALSSLLLLAGALPGLADEGRVARDQWQAWWRGARKLAWERERIEERPQAGAGEARFLVIERGAQAVAEGEVAWERRTETDAEGWVLSYTARETGPWGPTVVDARREGARLRWSARVRGNPPLAGVVEDAVRSPQVMVLLVRRGELALGRRQVRVLDLPGRGSEGQELEVRQTGEGWRVVRGKDDRHQRLLAADGSLVRGEDLRVAGERLLPASSEDAARFDAPAPAEVLAAVEEVELPGVRLRRPGPDWRLYRSEQPPMLMAEHPLGMAVFALRLPTAIPTAEADRLRVAEALRQALNPGMRQGEEGLELGAPAATTWREQPAVRFPVSGRVEGAPLLGQATLVGDGAGALLLMEALAADQALAHAGDLERAREAFGLASPEAWRRVTTEGLSLELPGTWSRADDGEGWRSPLGASRIRARELQLPPGLEPRQAQSMWAEAIKRNPNLEGLEVAREADTEVDGKFAHLMLLRGRLKPQADGITALGVRMASLVVPGDEGHCRELVVVCFELDWELAGLDRALGSIKWVEEH